MRNTIKLVPLVLSGCFGHQNVEVSPDFNYSLDSFQAEVPSFESTRYLIDSMIEDYESNMVNE